MSGGPKIVLASSSPRRRELLQEAGYAFEVVPPEESAECGVCSGETPPELVARLAWQKCANVRQRMLDGGVQIAARPSDGVVVGCDTVAECDEQALGKPADEDHARRMLRLLSGREHRVYSGLCVWPLREGGQSRVEVDVTVLQMAPLEERELQDHLASGAWEGKAGAFGLQDRPGWLRIVSGSVSNVVGLPLELLDRMLGGR